MIKLKSVSFESSPRLPGIRAGDTIDCDNPRDHLKNWRVMVRGTIVYFVSPPGWHPSQPKSQWDPNGPATICDIPRDTVFLCWLANDAAEVETVLKGGKFESTPLGWKPAPVEPEKSILSQIPAGQIGDA